MNQHGGLLTSVLRNTTVQNSAGVLGFPSSSFLLRNERNLFCLTNAHCPQHPAAHRPSCGPVVVRRLESTMPGLPRLRLAAFNDVYDLHNLPRIQTFLKQTPGVQGLLLCGDFLSPSRLSALDGGKGMVATLRAIGVTHVSLGNHEADLKLPKLEQRLRKLSKTAKVLNTNIGPFPTASWLTTDLKPYDILQTKCGRVNVALLGLLSDEDGVFRDGTFRGAPIRSVLNAYTTHRSVADVCVPMTHQSLNRDVELAEHMISCASSGQGQLILGGHEHAPHDEMIHGDDGRWCRILKSGTQAEALSLVDLTFDWNSEGKVELVDVDYDLVEMKDYEPSVFVQQIVDSHNALLDAMENEIIVQADNLLPPGVPLSSERTRYKQTTVGGIFCTALKEELEVDVAILNGAPIKGERTYPKPVLSYSELQQELPFPCKMVVVPMKRWQLHEAIHYSRTAPTEPGQEPGESVMRRGYLQVDVEFDRLGFHTGSQEDDLLVALPRNLMKGFCKIEPLMALGDKLKEEGDFPGEDDYIPAIDIIIRHFCKERWYQLVYDHYSFDDLDIDHKGFLSRDDVKRLLRKAVGHDPPDFLVGKSQYDIASLSAWGSLYDRRYDCSCRCRRERCCRRW